MSLDWRSRWVHGSSYLGKGPAAGWDMTCVCLLYIAVRPRYVCGKENKDWVCEGLHWIRRKTEHGVGWSCRQTDRQTVMEEEGYTQLTSLKTVCKCTHVLPHRGIKFPTTNFFRG